MKCLIYLELMFACYLRQDYNALFFSVKLLILWGRFKERTFLSVLIYNASSYILSFQIFVGLFLGFQICTIVLFYLFLPATEEHCHNYHIFIVISPTLPFHYKSFPCSSTWILESTCQVPLKPFWDCNKNCIVLTVIPFWVHVFINKVYVSLCLNLT